MEGTHQLVVALSPPTQDQLTETLSLELSRSQLFCLLSVIGEQASNIGKELLERWLKQTVLSAEAVYQVLTEYTQVASETETRISCAVIVFRGSRTTIATLRAGVSLRRGSLTKTVIKVSEGVEIREGSFQPQDLYFLYTELADRQAEDLLVQSKFPDQLLKQWQVCQAEVLNSATESVGLAVGLVLPSSILETQAGRGFSMIDNGFRVGEQIELGDIDESKSTDINLLQQRRASRKSAGSWKSKLNLTAGLIKAKFLNRSKKSQATDADLAREQKMIETLPAPADSLDSLSTSRGANIANSFYNLGIRLKSRQAVFVGHHLSRKKLLIMVGGVVLIIVTLLGAGYFRHSRQIEERVALERLAPYQEALDNISTLGETDPVSARTQAQSQLAELGSWQAEGNIPSLVKNELEQLISDTKSLYESLGVTSDLTALPLFDDLRRLSPSFLASTASGDGSQGILADRDQQLLIAYQTTDKSGQVIDAASLEKVTAVSQVGDRSFVLGDGVWSLANHSTTDLNQVIQSGPQTEGATLIASFGSNVYVFNPSQRALYRYVASGTTFSTPTNWLTGAAPFTYSDVSSLVVDGEVWFGTNQGQVYRFVSGRQAEFAITGLDQPLSSVLYLATSSESEIMAVLEPAAKRLLILDKDSGLVTREFVNPNLGAATGLWLDEVNNQVLVSSGVALYGIQITDSAP